MRARRERRMVVRARHLPAPTGSGVAVRVVLAAVLVVVVAFGALTQASAATTPTRIEQTDSRLVYSGSWYVVSSSLCSGGSLKQATSSGASVTVRFEGTGLDWIARKGVSSGVARVTLDSRTPVTVDLYSPATLYKQKVWSTGTLSSGSHTVKIEYTGTQNSASSGRVVNIDAVDVVGTLSSVTATTVPAAPTTTVAPTTTTVRSTTTTTIPATTTTVRATTATTAAPITTTTVRPTTTTTTLTATGKVYYVDATGGNDVNTGLSPTAAWKTLAKVKQSKYAPGDSILLKRGQVWREQLAFTASGSAGKPITIGAYGTGIKPIIMGSQDLSGSSKWKASGTKNIWVTTATIAIDVGSLIFNGETSVGAKKPALAEADTQGDFYYSPDADLLYLYSTSNPGLYYAHIEAALRQAGIMSYRNSYVTYQNIIFKYQGRHAFQPVGSIASPCAHIIVEDCDFSYIGGAYEPGGTERNGSAIEAFDTVTDLTIRRNTMDNVWENGFSIQCTTANSVIARIYFYGNRISDCAKGFEYWVVGPGTVISNIYICSNTFYNLGGNWGANQRVDLNWEGWMLWDTIAAANSKFVNNIVHTTAGRHVYVKALPDLVGWTVDYNCYYPDDVDHFRVASTSYSFGRWKVATARDAHSIASDPRLVNPGGGDFRLTAGSPCVDSGAVVSIIGQPAVGAPDMGAYY